MYYYHENEWYIIRDEINIDKYELKKLRNEVINNCSLIVHTEYNADYAPTIDQSLVRNYKENFVCKKEYFEETRDVIHYSYDELIPPKLVTLIDRLLNDDSTAVHDIRNYDYNSEKTIDKMIEEKNKELENTDEKMYNKRIMILQELKKLVHDKELNKNQQSTEEYYGRLWSFTKYSRHICMPKSDLNLNNVLEFLNMDLKIENGLLVYVQNNTSKVFKKKK